jgi:hypothetical protein
MSEKALGMLKHMRMQILGHPAPYVVVRGAAVSMGVNPGGSECGDLVDELLQAGYIQSYPSASLTVTGSIDSPTKGLPPPGSSQPRGDSPHSTAREAQTGVRRPWLRRVLGG